MSHGERWRCVTLSGPETEDGQDKRTWGVSPWRGEATCSTKGWCLMNDLTIYDTFAESWWQAGSPLHLLARMNPARFAYFDRWCALGGPARARCGLWRGPGSGCLVQRGARVVGLDLSWASLHVAARQTRRPGCPAAVFTCGRAEALLCRRQL